VVEVKPSMGEHVLLSLGIRRLGSEESGFFYRYPGTEETVREERVLTRIENLKVPPA
jgi:DNA topoisomerase IB